MSFSSEEPSDEEESTNPISKQVKRLHTSATKCTKVVQKRRALKAIRDKFRGQRNCVVTIVRKKQIETKDLLLLKKVEFWIIVIIPTYFTQLTMISWYRVLTYFLI